jgi:hypothetical protein
MPPDLGSANLDHAVPARDANSLAGGTTAVSDPLWAKQISGVMAIRRTTCAPLLGIVPSARAAGSSPIRSRGREAGQRQLGPVEPALNLDNETNSKKAGGRWRTQNQARASVFGQTGVVNSTHKQTIDALPNRQFEKPPKEADIYSPLILAALMIGHHFSASAL